MQIQVTVPLLISDCTGGQTVFRIEADTLSEALKEMVAAYPLLKVHLFTEQGEVRKHVLIYYNEDNIAWLEHTDIPLREGDRLRVLQAVSGG